MNDKIPTGSPLREALDRVNAMAGKLYPVGPETFAKIRTQEFRELQAAQEKPAPAPVTRSVQEISKNVDDTKALIEATKAKLAEYESDLKRELEELARACDKIDERTAELRKQYLPSPLPAMLVPEGTVLEGVDLRPSAVVFKAQRASITMAVMDAVRAGLPPTPPCHPTALWTWQVQEDGTYPRLRCPECGTMAESQPKETFNAQPDPVLDAVADVMRGQRPS